jgi:hypothetical protein
MEKWLQNTANQLQNGENQLQLTTNYNFYKIIYIELWRNFSDFFYILKPISVNRLQTIFLIECLLIYADHPDIIKYYYAGSRRHWHNILLSCIIWVDWVNGVVLVVWVDTMVGVVGWFVWLRWLGWFKWLRWLILLSGLCDLDGLGGLVVQGGLGEFVDWVVWVILMVWVVWVVWGLVKWFTLK